MNYKGIVTCLLLILSTLVKANYLEYYNTINQARYYTDDYSEKIALFEKAFENYTPFSDDAYTLSRYYFKTGNTKRAKKWILKAIELGKQFYPDSDYFEQYHSNLFPELDYLYPPDTTDKHEKFTVDYLKKRYKKLRSDFIKNCSPNPDFEQLLSAENYFQESRGYYFDNSREDDTLAYHYIQRYSYIINSNLCLDLMKNGQFPERRKTRRFNYKSISLLLNHVIAGFNSDEEKVLELLDYARELVFKGELTPWEFASTYDHYIVCYKDINKSVYGSRFHLNEDYELGINELLYPEKVDSLRKAIGLIPLRDWCENFGYNLPSNYE